MRVSGRRLKMLLAGAAGVLLWGCTAQRELYGAADAPVPVRTEAAITLRDEVQQREVTFRLHYPEAPGPLPLVVYSHGAFCSPSMYDAITTYWAGRGYAVLLPSHPDALDKAGRLAPDALEMLLSTRVRDLSFALDALDDIEASAGLRGRLDRERVAVAGHSFGGMIAMIKAGLVLRSGEYRLPGDSADPRFRAAVIMSGVGPLPPMAEDGFEGLTRPLFASGGTLDEGNVGSGQIYPWQWRMSPYTLAPPGDKYSLVLDAGDHYLGGLICRSDRGGAPDPEAVRIVAALTTAFLDAYLRQDRRALEYLREVDLAAMTGERAQLTRK